MKSYSSYKDSGVEWISQIPSEYSTIPIKHLIKNIIDNRGRTPDLEDEGIPYVEVKHVNKCGKHPTEKTTRFISKETYDNFLRKYLKEGDVLYTTVGTLGRTSIIPKDFYGCIIQNVVGFRINEKCLSTLFYYILNSKIGNHLIYDIVRGNIQGSVKVTDFIQQKIVIPPNNQQTQMVSFLDNKTQKIDELIEKTEQKIKLLKEKRTSLINHCVTKGLNPNVEMKDSGVKWIGEIPSGWEFIPLKNICYMKGRIGWKGLKQDEFLDDGDYYLITGHDIKNDRVDWNKCYHISKERYDESPEIMLEEQDLLFTKDGTIGKTLLIENLPKPTSLNSHLLVIRPTNNRYKSKFLQYIFKSVPFLVYVEHNKTGTTFYGVSQNTMMNFRGIFPPLSEQTQIVEYLDEQTQKIDSTIEKETQRIELLKEYRQSLISEVVTGKVDVRDWNK